MIENLIICYHKENIKYAYRAHPLTIFIDPRVGDILYIANMKTAVT